MSEQTTTCQICCLDETSFFSCYYCLETCCTSCFLRNTESKQSEPICLFCTKVQPRQYLLSQLDNKHLKQFKETRESILYERSKPLFAVTLEIVRTNRTRQSYLDVLIVERKEINDDITKRIIAINEKGSESQI
eukprot:Pgem_evm5s12679